MGLNLAYQDFGPLSNIFKAPNLMAKSSYSLIIAANGAIQLRKVKIV